MHLETPPLGLPPSLRGASAAVLPRQHARAPVYVALSLHSGELLLLRLRLHCRRIVAIEPLASREEVARVPVSA